jgi:hypothetical protein
MTTAVENILAVYDRATATDIGEGLAWYNRANALAWELDHADHRRAAGVIAALSPLLRWEKNVEYARLVYSLVGYDIDEVVNYVPVLRGSARKALTIANRLAAPTEVLGGIKVTSFYHNIAFPYETQHVTIDKHAVDLADGIYRGYKDSPSIGKRKYEEYSQYYRAAASRAGVSAPHMQAITWTVWRKENVRGVS